MAVDEEPLASISPEGASAPELSGPPKKKRHVTRGILILMILTVAGVVAPFIANLFAGGLASAKVFPVTIRNDTSVPLVAQQCGSGCLPDVAKVPIPVGGSAQVNVTSGGAVTRYYLLDASGHLAGCLPLRFSKEVAGFTVGASQAETCPGSPIGAP
ncbi:MAG: hypothetical protein QOH66_3018 [Actinomycetota bacterium]|nr:hypothetical protein [Actinomycetota bacterium]